MAFSLRFDKRTEQLYIATMGWRMARTPGWFHSPQLWVERVKRMEEAGIIVGYHAVERRPFAWLKLFS